jgi:hypothetical protein
MIREFDCIECRRHIVRFSEPVRTAGHDPAPALCAECLHIPGWYKDSNLRRIFDPEMPETPKENDDG